MILSRWLSTDVLVTAAFDEVMLKYVTTGRAVFAWEDDDGPRYWLLDSGAAQDMISRYQIPKHMIERIYNEHPPITLNTANGSIDVKERLVYKLNMGSLKEIKPWVLDDTPAVISIGQLVMLHGYGFYWHPYDRVPKFVAPDGSFIECDVDENYIPSDSQACELWHARR